ncbi:hypothetical protein Ocin01_14597 [Orchesella cincta]|uniref:Uncharacterized protein n=1 Tax=Orchesella cincta TaxID=48709 RepID=A0A1D2MGI8_ORCCI|nr:hypothetical protein Ocin01_14597 [Orchesella cincta]
MSRTRSNMIPEEDLPHLRKEILKTPSTLVDKGKSGGHERTVHASKRANGKGKDVAFQLKLRKGFTTNCSGSNPRRGSDGHPATNQRTKKKEGLDSDDEYENAPEVTTAMLLARRNRKLGSTKSELEYCHRILGRS